ncbi:MAG: imidazoleglycerol-phosphate dehydratase HisB [FCB group bacterium]|jgi:imidazoleglycerol-phosphate dehydratase|nr:imidazoleglycerol-phosphate dehydratase HisB [FCB group bacterium]
MRRAELNRDTAETKIRLVLELDGEGRAEVNTGIGFFDHMLTHLAKHSLMNLTVAAEGDLHIDAHHTVEDVGICLGKAFAQALGEPKGLVRYGRSLVPMDEALAEAAVDISGRPFLSFRAELPGKVVGRFDAELAEEFLRAFAVNARITLHVNLRYGGNLHHCIEGIFKAVARALGEAVRIDPRVKGVPSTKGMLEA